MAVNRLGTKDLINRRDAKDAKEKKIGHRFTQIKHRLKLFFNPKNLRSSVSKSSLLFSSLRSLCLCGERGFIISYTSKNYKEDFLLKYAFSTSTAINTLNDIVTQINSSIALRGAVLNILCNIGIYVIIS